VNRILLIQVLKKIEAMQPLLIPDIRKIEAKVTLLILYNKKIEAKRIRLIPAIGKIEAKKNELDRSKTNKIRLKPGKIEKTMRFIERVNP
jgi:hypothetical protein